MPALRISDRYIARQVLSTTLYAILFLSLILVMGTVMKQVRMLLVDLNQPISKVAHLIVSTLPVSLIYTIPWAFLASVLLVVGRMSGDQEITGFRVAGVSLRRLMMPIFVIAGLLSLLCMWLNVTVAPDAWARVDQIVFSAFTENPQKMLVAAVENDSLDRLEEHMKGTKAYIRATDGDRAMQGMHIFRGPDTKDGKESKSGGIYVYAKVAESIADQSKKEFSLRLHDAVFATTDDEGKPQVITAEQAVPLVLPFESMREGRMKPKFLTNRGIREYVSSPKGVELRKKSEGYYVLFMTEIYKRYAGSFACLAFAFVGVPLGIKARRRDTSTGLVLSLIIGSLYFVAPSVAQHTLQAGMIWAWAPNVICVILGLIFLRRSRFN